MMTQLNREYDSEAIGQVKTHLLSLGRFLSEESV